MVDASTSFANSFAVKALVRATKYMNENINFYR